MVKMRCSQDDPFQSNRGIVHDVRLARLRLRHSVGYRERYFPTTCSIIEAATAAERAVIASVDTLPRSRQDLGLHAKRGRITPAADS